MHVWLRGIASTAAGLGVVLITAVRALGVRLYPLPVRGTCEDRFTSKRPREAWRDTTRYR